MWWLQGRPASTGARDPGLALDAFSTLPWHGRTGRDRDAVLSYLARTVVEGPEPGHLIAAFPHLLPSAGAGAADAGAPVEKLSKAEAARRRVLARREARQLAAERRRAPSPDASVGPDGLFPPPSAGATAGVSGAARAGGRGECLGAGWGASLGQGGGLACERLCETAWPASARRGCPCMWGRARGFVGNGPRHHVYRCGACVPR